MVWNVQIDRDALRQLKRIPRKDAERIKEAVRLFSDDPFWGDIEKMKGEDKVWRRRVGNYRIQYEIINRDKVVYVFKISRRTSSTY